MRKEFRELIPLQEAKSIIFDHPPRPREETVPLVCSRDRILAEKIISKVDVPSFHRASMDGYAVQAADTLESREDRPVSLRLAGCVPMGRLPDLRVSRGEAAEVSTGSMMPGGVDAVVMIEYSQAKDGLVYVRRPVYSGENVQNAGSDISFGEAVLFPGTRIASREMGVLAALGRETVRVLSLKVGVASTGGELVPPGRCLGPGQIYDINTYAISAGVQECGAAAVPYGILPDERAKMAETLQKMAQECEMVLVSGSTSAGAGDMVYQVLEEIGELIFHGVNLKPGKPTIFGLIDGKPCLGLPGYPTSALTVFYELAAPVIRKALGQKHQGNKTSGRLAGPLRTEGRQQMLAVGVAGSLVYPVDKGSGSITTLALADGVIEIPAGVEYLASGAAVEVKLFRELQAPNLIVAGENSIILERLAERLPWRLALLNTGSLWGRAYLEDGVADLAAVSSIDAAPVTEGPEGLTAIKGYKRELGLIYRDAEAMSDPASRIVGWHRDSVMLGALERALLDQGLANPGYVRVAKTHSAVAAAVASRRADLGFGERAVAVEAGLGFKFVAEDEIQFLARSEAINNFWLKSLICSLLQE
jgi:putative molybdopterin biosynthesis protein